MNAATKRTIIRTIGGLAGYYFAKKTNKDPLPFLLIGFVAGELIAQNIAQAPALPTKGKTKEKIVNSEQ